MYHKEKEFSASPVTSFICDPCHSCRAGGALCAFSALESCSLFSPPAPLSRFGRPGGQQGRRKEGGVSVVRRMEVEGNDGV